MTALEGGGGGEERETERESGLLKDHTVKYTRTCTCIVVYTLYYTQISYDRCALKEVTCTRSQSMKNIPRQQCPWSVPIYIVPTTHPDCLCLCLCCCCCCYCLRSIPSISLVLLLGVGSVVFVSKLFCSTLNARHLGFLLVKESLSDSELR